MRGPRINRRLFLKTAGAAGLAAIPTVIGGYSLLRTAQGELPPVGSPYVDDMDLERLNAATSAPILLLAPEQSSNPHRAYLSEILRAEGLNAFHYLTTGKVDWTGLARYGS